MPATLPTHTRVARASWARAMQTRLAVIALLLAPLGCGGDDDDDDSPTGPGDAVALTSGTAVQVSGAEGSLKLYRIVVPSGATQIVFQTRGGTGDLDMYVRAGQVPSQTGVTCFSENVTNDEDCEIDNPQAGDWYILLVGYEAYSGATLTATVTAGTSP